MGHVDLLFHPTHTRLLGLHGSLHLSTGTVSNDMAINVKKSGTSSPLSEIVCSITDYTERSQLLLLFSGIP